MDPLETRPGGHRLPTVRHAIPPSISDVPSNQLVTTASPRPHQDATADGDLGSVGPAPSLTDICSTSARQGSAVEEVEADRRRFTPSNLLQAHQEQSILEWILPNVFLKAKYFPINIKRPERQGQKNGAALINEISYIDAVDGIFGILPRPSSFAGSSAALEYACPPYPNFVELPEQDNGRSALQSSPSALSQDLVASIANDSSTNSHDASVTAAQPPLSRSYQQLVADPREFAHHWEKKVVPYVVSKLSSWSKTGFSVNVVRDRAGERRQVLILTHSALKQPQHQKLRHEILQSLTENFHVGLDFVFAEGTVAASTGPADKFDQRGANYFWQREPVMGDSAGVSHQDGGGTLGPLLQIDGVGYWLANSHIATETLKRDKSARYWAQHSDIELHQPANHDYHQMCSSLPPETLAQQPVIHRLGSLAALSGEPFKTCRESLHGFGGQNHKVVTDWMLFRSSGLKKNRMRVTRGEDVIEASGFEIVSGSEVKVGQKVCISGRTSGFTEAYICEVPAVVLPYVFNPRCIGCTQDQHQINLRGNGTGEITREWAISHHPKEPTDNRPRQQDPESYKTWVEKGCGLPGDSGGPVVDSESHVLYGQLWGRNEYSDSQIKVLRDGSWVETGQYHHIPRIAYFTSYDDIADDIMEKMKPKPRKRPVLPNDDSMLQAAGDRLAAESQNPMRSSINLKSQLPPKRLPTSILRMLGINEVLVERVASAVPAPIAITT